MVMSLKSSTPLPLGIMNNRVSCRFFTSFIKDTVKMFIFDYQKRMLRILKVKKKPKHM
jgi:hypothetical protein